MTAWSNRIVRYGTEAPDQLLANPLNFRIHPKPQQDALSGALTEVGWLAPVIVNETTGHVIDGHLRVELAISRNEPSVPVAYVTLSEDEERLALATFDPIGALAVQDQDKLDELLAGLNADDQHLVQFLATLRTEPPRMLNEDDADLTPPAVPITKPGDLWLMGQHRLLCGDSTKREDVEWLLAGAKPGLLIADPPYGMRLDADFSGMKSGLRFAQDKGMHGGRAYPQVTGDDQDFDAQPVLRHLGIVPEQFWFGADYYAATLPDTQHAGAWLVWDKRLDETADRMYGSCFELIWSSRRCRREMLRYKWAGVFGVEQEPDRRRHHPNQKPVALMADLIARTAGLVVDPFAGAGAVLVAAEQEGRLCYAMEIEPAYVDVIVRRWEHLTGQKAVLERAPVEVPA
jgi:DNA modification methylase